MEGVQWRIWTWEQTQPIRFTGDISRGYRYGRRAALEGYFDLYDKVLTETRDRYLELDYAPLRLWVMMQWARSIPTQFGLPQRWQPERAFTAPALRFNIMMELVAAVGIFLLVRHWLRRATQPPSADHDAPTSGATSSRSADLMMPTTDTQNALNGWLIPLVGALLFWFNPAVMLSAHGWPTWDMWVIPFFIWALYLACKDCWFFSGMVLALGALFKGQQLIVAPFFLLWPLFMKKPGSAFRWGIGFTFGVSAVASLWLLRHAPDAQRLIEIANLERPLRPENNNGGITAEQLIKHNVPRLRAVGDAAVNWWAAQWVSAVALGHALIGLRKVWPRPTGGRWWWVLSLIAMAGIGWAWWQVQPITGSGHWTSLLRTWSWWVGLMMMVGVGVSAWCLPRRWQGVGLALWVSLALWLCLPMFEPSTGWYQIGWAYGEKHWQWMIMGLTDNIPGLLTKRFGFDKKEGLLSVAFTLPQGALWFWPGADFAVTYKKMFAAIYAGLLVLCAWGAARHDRAGDKRFLVAATAPWLMMYLVLGQIHERYLLFAAGVAACWAAVHWGMVLMYWVLTIITFKMTIHVMLNGPARRGPWYAPEGVLLTQETAKKWLRWCDATHPDLAWAVIVCAGVVLYLTLARPRRKVYMNRS